MSWLRRALDFLLNPRAQLDQLPSGVSPVEGPEEAERPRRLNLRLILLNFPLLLGALIVLGLFVLVLFGPVWAPQNPYITGQHVVPHFDKELDKFISPPLPPSPEYPLGTNRWGTDLLSLLMHGARNTLIAAAMITLSRVILGALLGGLAGWNEGRPVDRAVMGLVGVTTSIPMLISSMILIYALDIRRGLPVFIAALTLIGWTEIAQYVRSEFLVLRKMPFIDGAYAVGSGDFAIAIRHCLPNILPQLLVITFLEMGAVLMLLGELGFIGVYIGGGHQVAFFELMAPTRYFTLSEVPEWGAMLAEGYQWLRSKPFVVLPPAASIFISIIGFTSLGEGFRRLIEERSLNTGFLLRKRTLLIIVLILVASGIVLNNTGASPWYAKVAGSFSGTAAYEHTANLSAMDGRGAGQPGGTQAADYIEARFQEYGLLPGWKKDSYRYLVPARRVELLAQPELNLLDQEGEVILGFRHQVDFGFVTEGYGGSGSASLPLTFVGFSQTGDLDWETLSGLDLRGRIILLQAQDAPDDFGSEALLHGAAGVLWITGEGRDDVRSQYLWVDLEGDHLHSPSRPIFRIRPSTASAILDQAGLTLENLSSGGLPSTQSGPGWFTVDLDLTVQMTLALSPAEAVEIPCLLGYRPGYDLNLASDMLVMFASYDGLGTDPDGTVFPGANHNAAGVGILLEIARLWNDQELDPRRSILFVAWAGALEPGLADEFLGTRANFSHLITNNPYENVSPGIIVQLDYGGAGSDPLLIHPRSGNRLAVLLEDAALQIGIPVERAVDSPEFTADIVTHGLEWMSLRWSAAQTGPLEDGLDQIDPDRMESLGQTLSLALINLIREADY